MKNPAQATPRIFAQDLLTSIVGLDHHQLLKKTAVDLIRDRSAPNLDARLKHTLSIS